jgi:hypothetical protein
MSEAKVVSSVEKDSAEWAKSFGDAYNVIAVTSGLLITCGVSALFALSPPLPGSSVDDSCLRPATILWVTSISFLFVPAAAMPAIQFFLVRAMSYHQRQEQCNIGNNNGGSSPRKLHPAPSISMMLPPPPVDVVVKRAHLARFIDAPAPSRARHLSLFFFFFGSFTTLVAILFSVQYKFTSCNFGTESGIIIAAISILFIILVIIYRSANQHLSYTLCKSICD